RGEPRRLPPGGLRESALIEGAALEYLRQLGDDQLELVLGQVRLHAADECAGDYHARPVTGDLLLEHQIPVITPAAVVLKEADAGVVAAEGALAPRSGQGLQPGGGIDP